MAMARTDVEVIGRLESPPQVRRVMILFELYALGLSGETGDGREAAIRGFRIASQIPNFIPEEAVVCTIGHVMISGLAAKGIGPIADWIGARYQPDDATVHLIAGHWSAEDL